MNAVDEEMMKYECERCLTVLGFTHSSNIRRERRGFGTWRLLSLPCD